MIGIDPGKTGALVALNVGVIVDVLDMPLIGYGKTKAEYVDGKAVADFITRNRPGLIVVEQVAARPGQGVVSMFNFGCSFGSVLGVALASDAEVFLVAPVRWKRRMGLLRKEKDAARLEALRRWPNDVHYFKRKKDIGRADAALLAEYGLHFTR